MRIGSSLPMILILLASLPACSRSCGKAPPFYPPLITDKDGRQKYVVDKEGHRAFYDRWGRLERIERDSNGDGRKDQVSHHGGAKQPFLLEIDSDFDDRFDRWEYYDRESGALVKIGSSRRGWAPDVWIHPGPDGHPLKREYDEDGDNRVDRVELLHEGRLVRTETDADRDGRFDRWESWLNGRMIAEEIDTNGDGLPDHRIKFSKDGKVDAIERIRKN